VCPIHPHAEREQESVGEEEEESPVEEAESPAEEAESPVKEAESPVGVEEFLRTCISWCVLWTEVLRRSWYSVSFSFS